MKYETVVGLEVHVELSTESKLFCSCSTEFCRTPNTHCCEVCMGFPGTLPTLNKKVVEYAVKVGLALDCEITRKIKFDRKNYFYPDLPKAYQISQLYLPICKNGHIKAKTADGSVKNIGISDIHIEEDAGKSVHVASPPHSLIDYNRCGIPLLEIVSAPDFRSTHEVISYLENLKSTLQFLGVSDCKMQEGSLRVDINLSVRPEGQKELGVRTEMKNIGSFKAVRRAIEHESARQIALIESGEPVLQETRRWDEDKNMSFSMRSKENSTDYKYFPEPDIPPVAISEDMIRGILSSLPELPDSKHLRYREQYHLSDADASLLVSSPKISALFESAAVICSDPKECAKWILGEVLMLLSEHSMPADDLDLSPESLGKIILLVKNGTVNRTIGKEVLAAVFENGTDPEEYIRINKLQMENNTDAIRTAAQAVLEQNASSVEQYRAGKEQVLQFLIGQTMRQLRGKANPKAVADVLKSLLTTK